MSTIIAYKAVWEIEETIPVKPEVEESEEDDLEDSEDDDG